MKKVSSLIPKTKLKNANESIMQKKDCIYTIVMIQSTQSISSLLSPFLILDLQSLKVTNRRKVDNFIWFLDKQMIPQQSYQEYLEEQISVLKGKWEEIKKQIKVHVNNFWKQVKANVQLSLHPQVIESKSRLVKQLKLEVGMSRKELEQHKYFSKDLLILADNRNS